MKASDLFLECLIEQGVDTIFGVPGEENADIMISLLKYPIEFITCRHEQSAAFMAEMYGRMTGKPGVCLATLGPGATNLITGVAEANMDHAPLIAIIGQASTTRLHKQSHQNMDAISMYKPVSKWATTIRDAEVIPEVISKAFKLAVSSKPGACVIELPEDIAGREIESKPLSAINQSTRLGADIQSLDAALKLLANSKVAVMLLGAGAAREHCDHDIEDFLNQTNIYAANTFMGKGAVSAKNKHSLFCVGLGMKDLANEAFDQADLVICVGYDMVEWHPDHWNIGAKKNIIHIDSLPAEVDKNYLPDVELIGNVGTIIRSLNAAISSEHTKDPNQFKILHEKILKELCEYKDDEAFPVKPQKIITELRAAMSDQDILISDVGAHKMWVARQFPTYQSGTCFIYNGFCSMGGAMPAAFTAKRLKPERNVVALCGDGGFIMSIQALVSAVQYKVPFTVLLWEDNSYGLIKWKQDAAYHKHSHIDLANPDLTKLSEAFGCHAIKINAANELHIALQNSFLEKERPTVIVVPVDYSENMKLTERLGELVCH